MSTLIGRLLMFVVAVLLACDALLPTHVAIERVDRHVTTVRRHNQNDYDLWFAGGDVLSCNVGWSAYDTLKDGDEVTLTVSRVFKSCQGIERDDVAVVRPGAGKWVLLAVAVFLFVGAFGWIDLGSRRADRDDDDARDDRPGSWWQP